MGFCEIELKDKITLYNIYDYIRANLLCVVKRNEADCLKSSDEKHFFEDNSCDESKILSEFSIRKKKKIKKQILRYSKDRIHFLSDEIQRYFSNEISLETLIGFLQEIYFDINSETQKSLENIGRDFGRSVKEDFTSLIGSFECFCFRTDENKAELLIEETSSYMRKLVLKNAKSNFETCDFCQMFLEYREGVYVLFGLSSVEDEFSHISFSGIELSEEAFKSYDYILSETGLWEEIIKRSCHIVSKHYNTNLSLCEKEKDIFPLLQEIKAYFAGENISYPELTSLFENEGSKKLCDAFLKWKDSDFKIPSLYRNVSKATKEKCCEPLFRRLYERIIDSQKDYPSRNSEPSIFSIEVEEKMTEFGYSGKYPNFKKCSGKETVFVRFVWCVTFVRVFWSKASGVTEESDIWSPTFGGGSISKAAVLSESGEIAANIVVRKIEGKTIHKGERNLLHLGTPKNALTIILLFKFSFLSSVMLSPFLVIGLIIASLSDGGITSETFLNIGICFLAITLTLFLIFSFSFAVQNIKERINRKY